MTVYVDPLKTYPVTIEGHDTWCHMTADTVEELHALAASIGLKREWFQDHDRHPHYDLTADKRSRALMNRAIEGLTVVERPDVNALRNAYLASLTDHSVTAVERRQRALAYQEATLKETDMAADPQSIAPEAEPAEEPMGPEFGEPLVDPETGEVLGDQVEATITVNGGEPVPLKTLQRRVDRLGQMSLFEGHKVDLFQTQIKPSKGAARPLTPEIALRLPTIRETRFFVMQVQTVAIEHADGFDGDGYPVMTRIVKYAPQRTREIDQATAESLLAEDED